MQKVSSINNQTSEIKNINKIDLHIQVKKYKLFLFKLNKTENVISNHR